MHSFAIIFIAALTVTTLIKVWLAKRHIRHIQTHRAHVPIEFVDHIDLNAHQKAADYSSAKTRLATVQTLLGAIVLLGLTLGGGIQALSDFWVGIIDPQQSPLIHGTALILSAFLLIGIIDLPLSIYGTFVIEQRFGFNKTTPRLFIIDLIKQTILSLVIGVPLLLGVLWLMERMGEYWWLYVWLAWMAFNLLILAIYPVFIAPLFNKFSPLQDEQLKLRIERLLNKVGFKAKGLFVMDGSRRSSHGNAYFTGFGKSKRIVFFDTLLEHLSHEEIEAVLAHELGHFKKRHIVKRIVLIFAVSLPSLWLLDWFMHQTWFYTALGVTSQSTASALLLFMLVSPVFTFLLHPLSSLYSRKHEFEADQYAAEFSEARNLIHALVKLYRDNAATLTPDPIHSAFYDSHPPASIRIARLQRAPN